VKLVSNSGCDFVDGIGDASSHDAALKPAAPLHFARGTVDEQSGRA
jgi:hypothetical protein